MTEWLLIVAIAVSIRCTVSCKLVCSDCVVDTVFALSVFFPSLVQCKD